MNKYVLITGGGGFIGSHLTQELSKIESNIVVVDNFNSSSIEHLRDIRNIKIINGDISEKSFLENLFAEYRFKYIYHLAAIPSVGLSISDPISTNKINQTATLLLLECAKLQGVVEKFVFSSSASVYGNSLDMNISEQHFIDPLTPYAIDKMSCEKYLQAYYQLFGLPTVSLRYFNVYGPRQNPASEYSGVISILSQKMISKLKGENSIFNVYGDGKQTRDFVYVKDVADANILVSCHKDAIGRVFNIGTGLSTSLNDLIDLYTQVTSIKLEVSYGHSKPGDIKHSCADISSIRNIGFKPSYSLSEGLTRYWEYIKEMQI